MTIRADADAPDPPALFSAGLRPFFLAGAVWAALSAPLWVMTYLGMTAEVEFSRNWHMHEMLFGFLAAIVAGFLLTSVPNWTRRPPIVGAPLAILFSLWAAGRTAMLFEGLLGPALTPLADGPFLVIFAVVIGREIVVARNWRNLGVVAAVAILAAANIAFHLDGRVPQAADVAPRAALAAIAFLLALIGGRITPSFSRNWLARRGASALPAMPGRLDLAALIATAGATLGWAAAPQNGIAGAALIAAGLVNFARLCRWQGRHCGGEALVWILHLGFLWLCLGLVGLGLSALAPALVPRTAGIHALTAGAVGVMTLAVMTRASLGHTGRPLTAGRSTVAIYGLINAAAVVRVSAALVPAWAGVLLAVSAGLWSLAFGLFAVTHFAMLSQPRPA